MKHVFVRPARQEDFPNLVRWSESNPAWDPKVFTYPTTITLAAFSDTGVIAYMPVEQPLVMDAVAFHPLATDCQKAAAMKELTHALVTQAYVKGAGEILFRGSDEGTNAFAEAHGFTRLAKHVRRPDPFTRGATSRG